jgi:hypothetical protein
MKAGSILERPSSSLIINVIGPLFSSSCWRRRRKELMSEANWFVAAESPSENAAVLRNCPSTYICIDTHYICTHTHTHTHTHKYLGKEAFNSGERRPQCARR